MEKWRAAAEKIRVGDNLELFPSDRRGSFWGGAAIGSADPTPRLVEPIAPGRCTEGSEPGTGAVDNLSRADKTRTADRRRTRCTNRPRRP